MSILEKGLIAWCIGGVVVVIIDALFGDDAGYISFAALIVGLYWYGHREG